MGKRKKTGQAISLAAIFFGVIIMVCLCVMLVEHKPTFPPLPESFLIVMVTGQPVIWRHCGGRKGAHVLYMHTSEPEAERPVSIFRFLELLIPATSVLQV